MLSSTKNRCAARIVFSLFLFGTRAGSRSHLHIRRLRFVNRWAAGAQCIRRLCHLRHSTRERTHRLLSSGWRQTGRVDVTDLDADPLRQLSAWLDAARAAGQPMPEAMTLASATSDAFPSARLVMLRGLQHGLVFFTDCQSDKGAELVANPRAAAVLHWLVPAHRQVRAAGPVEQVSEDEADKYWSTRAPAVRLNAAASHQSRVIASRAVLQMQLQDQLRRHPGGAAVPRPRRWGGFRVLPSRVEFWQESPDGLHDRIRYHRGADGWALERLSP
jgi:pyridoxamine 5'-phosphate oxidase